jgi:hypothetical protein
MTFLDLSPGMPVVLYLHEPKEKIWGILVSIHPAGLVIHGLELSSFDEWMRQVASGGDAVFGLVTAFYPMSRVQRMERDESVGPFTGYADRFAQEVGRTVRQVLGLDPEAS